MTTAQWVLDHQRHPLNRGVCAYPNLALVGGVGPVRSLLHGLLWRCRLWAALVVQLVPAVVASVALICCATREPPQRSARGRSGERSIRGRYVERPMTPTVHGVRLGRHTVLSLGAWNSRPAVLLAGLASGRCGWLRGRLGPTVVPYD